MLYLEEEIIYIETPNNICYLFNKDHPFPLAKDMSFKYINNNATCNKIYFIKYYMLIYILFIDILLYKLNMDK